MFRFTIFLTVFFWAWAAPAVSSKYTYKELETLFNQGVPLTAANVPENGVEHSTIVNENSTLLVGEAVVTKIGKSILIGEVYNAGIQDAEAVVHLKACQSIIPVATEDKALNGFVSWGSYSGFRQVSPINPDGSVYIENLNRLLWRLVTLNDRSTLLVVRSDVLEPGVQYHGISTQPINQSAFAYSYSKGFTPVVPATGITASCNELIAPYTWQEVASNPQ